MLLTVLSSISAAAYTEGKPARESAARGKVVGEGLLKTLPESFGVFLIELVVVVRVQQLFGVFLHLNPLDVYHA